MPVTLKYNDLVLGNGSTYPAALVAPADDPGPPKPHNPEISWTAAGGATHYALLVRDSFPNGEWYHWVVYNLPTTLVALPQLGGDMAILAADPAGTIGLNSWNTNGFGWPTPPADTGLHSYRFTVFAQSAQIEGADLNGAQALAALQGQGAVEVGASTLVIQTTTLVRPPVVSPAPSNSGGVSIETQRCQISQSGAIGGGHWYLPTVVGAPGTLLAVGATGHVEWLAAPLAANQVLTAVAAPGFPDVFVPTWKQPSQNQNPEVQ
jgi:phosphatidylethanolamine-binding protein (PEBP) family uncharacterized protein